MLFDKPYTNQGLLTAQFWCGPGLDLQTHQILWTLINDCLSGLAIQMYRKHMHQMFMRLCNEPTCL